MICRYQFRYLPAPKTVDRSKQIISNRRSNPTNHERTYPLLGELPSPLVLCVPQEFNDAALIGGKTGDLADNVADEGSPTGGTALGAADTGLGGVKGGGFLLAH